MPWESACRRGAYLDAAYCGLSFWYYMTAKQWSHVCDDKFEFCSRALSSYAFRLWDRFATNNLPFQCSNKIWIFGLPLEDWISHAWLSKGNSFVPILPSLQQAIIIDRSDASVIIWVHLILSSIPRRLVLKEKFSKGVMSLATLLCYFRRTEWRLLHLRLIGSIV